MVVKSEVGMMIMIEFKWIMCNGLLFFKILFSEIEVIVNIKFSMVDKFKIYFLI